MKKQHATSRPSQLVSSRVESEVIVFQVKSSLKFLPLSPSRVTSRQICDSSPTRVESLRLESNCLPRTAIEVNYDSLYYEFLIHGVLVQSYMLIICQSMGRSGSTSASSTAYIQWATQPRGKIRKQETHRVHQVCARCAVINNCIQVRP